MEENIVDYGPLTALVGIWEGNKGLDIAPEENGEVEENPYFERIEFVEAGSLKNAGRQELAMLRYHQVVQRSINKEVFHDEVGYWIWDAANKTIMRSFTIPRGVCVLAGGIFKPTQDETTILEVNAGEEYPGWDIAQSPFMVENAKTVAFKSRFEITGNKLSFYQNTILDIYGRVFDHEDKSELIRNK